MVFVQPASVWFSRKASKKRDFLLFNLKESTYLEEKSQLSCINIQRFHNLQAPEHLCPLCMFFGNSKVCWRGDDSLVMTWLDGRVQNFRSSQNFAYQPFSSFLLKNMQICQVLLPCESESVSVIFFLLNDHKMTTEAKIFNDGLWWRLRVSPESIFWSQWWPRDCPFGSQGLSVDFVLNRKILAMTWKKANCCSAYVILIYCKIYWKIDYE